MPFSPVWDAIAAHFFSSASLSRVIALRRAEVQAEGWFKGPIAENAAGRDPQHLY